MGLENLKPLDELKSLDQQIEYVQDLAGLKPIFFRLEEIAKENVNDFDVQLAVGDIKQHLVNRGTKLKEMRDTRPTPVPPPAPFSPPSPLPEFPPSGPSGYPVSGPPIDTPPITPHPIAPPADFPESRYAPPSPPMPPPGIPATPPPGSWATTENPPPPVAPPPPTQGRTAPIPAKPAAPPTPVKPAPAKKGPPPNWQKWVLIGVAGGLVVVAAIFMGLSVHRRHLREAAANALIQVQIATTPSGAAVKVNGDQQCTSNCSLSLAPGNYQITAFLDGYEPAGSGIAVAAGQPVSVNLTLEAQAQSLRIITDLDQGKVSIDSDPPADLQDSQFILDRVLAGPHTVKVTGKNGEASFSFEIADAKQPTITGPVTARNLATVLVASMANQAHVVTSMGPAKLVVNGQPEQDTNPSGVDLKNFQTGVDEVVVGEGNDQHSVKENFGPAPMLTAFLRSDVNLGTLTVSTGEDDVRVFLGNKEYPRRTQRGVVHIPTIGTVTVKVMKDGFDTPPPQTAEVKKGADTRLDFKLKALPKYGTLQVVGGTAGAEVLIDQRGVGTIGSDGALTDGFVTPGDRAIEIRRDGFGTHRFNRTFRAGETITVSGADVTLTANPPPVAPPPTTAKKIEPPPAPKKDTPPAAPPAPKAGTMADWDDPASWHTENGVSLHQGGGFVPYKLPPNGTFTFTVQLVKGGGFLRSGHIKWCLNYIDAKNYSLFEMDNKNFWAKVVSNGKTSERTHTQLKDLEKQKSFTIQIDVTPEHVVHKMFTGGDWINLDTWAETGRNFSEGKFGFLLEGKDEIGLSDFKFQPK